MTSRSSAPASPASALAIRLQQAGLERLRDPRARRGRRRHLARQPLPRRRLRRPVAPLLVLVRAEPALVAHIFARRARSWSTSRVRRQVRPPRAHSVRHASCASARWDEDAGRWAVDTDAGVFDRATSLVLGDRPLSAAVVPALPGLERFAGAKFHSARWRDDYDLRGQARRRHRHRRLGSRSCRRSSRAVEQPGRLPAHAAVGHAAARPRRSRARSAGFYAHVPARPAVRAERVYWPREALVPGFASPAAHAPRSRSSARATSRRQVTRPRAAREAHAELPRSAASAILFSNDYYPALAGRTSSSSPTIADVRAACARRRRRRRARRSTRSSAAPASRSPTCRSPHRILGRGGAHAGRRLARRPEAYRGTAIAGFPNFFMIVGPNTGLGHNSMMLMIEAQIDYSWRASARCASGAARRRGPRGGAGRYIDDLQGRPEGRSGSAAVRAGTWTTRPGTSSSGRAAPAGSAG